MLPRTAGARCLALMILLAIAVVSPRSLASSRISNFRHLSWTQAFDAMHHKLSRDYPLTAWKGIQWPALRAKYRHRVAEAERRHDAREYYLAIREYAFSLPDGHVALDGDDQGTMYDAVGGGTGLGLAELDDGRVIIANVVHDSPAAQAGIPAGSELLRWQGKPVHEALAAVSLLWTDGPVATKEGRRAEQLHFLPRAPVGTSINLVYSPPGTTVPRTATLTAIDDGFDYLSETDTMLPIDSRHTVRGRILSGNIGYIRLEAEDELSVDGHDWKDPAETELPVYYAFKRTMQSFLRRHVRALILDLRANEGGDDDIGERIVGFFEPEPVFWERSPSCHSTSRSRHCLEYSQPQKIQFDGPVVVLIDRETVSDGEGIASALQRSGRAAIAGTEGTFGAFGEVGGEIHLPGGLVLSYPRRASLDTDGRVQLDSNASGEGGVQPDVRVPKTYDTVMRQARGEDVELEAAIHLLTPEIAPQAHRG